jgi:hypothetical protein
MMIDEESKILQQIKKKIPTTKDHLANLNASTITCPTQTSSISNGHLYTLKWLSLSRDTRNGFIS